MNRLLNLIFSLLLFSSSTYADEVPTGKLLLEACQQLQAGQAEKMSTMLCHWYVTPCDCHYGNNERLPRVCLPYNVDVSDLATIIVEHLKDNQSLLTLSAEAAAANILAPLYPCDDI